MPGANYVEWSLESAESGDAVVAPVRSLDLIGFELFTLEANASTACVYNPGDYPDLPQGPTCPGPSWEADVWTKDGIDGWIWNSHAASGTLNVNKVAGGNYFCHDGVRSRRSPSQRSVSVIGYDTTRQLGITAVSSQVVLPFWTGERAHDIPGRCHVFTAAPATVQVAPLCGSVLPYYTRVGIFGDISSDGRVGSTDAALWRRAQVPDADEIYFTSMVFKFGLHGVVWTFRAIRQVAVDGAARAQNAAHRRVAEC